jgi:hypothetical protein
VETTRIRDRLKLVQEVYQRDQHELAKKLNNLAIVSRAKNLAKKVKNENQEEEKEKEEEEKQQQLQSNPKRQKRQLVDTTSGSTSPVI